MTFPPQKPQPFERAAVVAYRAGVRGCYGLFRRDRWVYIGAGDIRQRLLAHLDGDGPWPAGEPPTHWVAVESAEPDALARDLVLACDPLCQAGSGPSVQTTGRSASGR